MALVKNKTTKQAAAIPPASTIVLRLAVLGFASIILSLCVFVLPMGIASDNSGLYSGILLGLYVPAIPFFYAIYQTMKLLNLIDKNKAFSMATVRALGRIKGCGAMIAGLFVLGLPYIYYVANEDDAPGVVALALVIIGASIAIGVFAAVLQRLLQSAIAIKSENDLTV